MLIDILYPFLLKVTRKTIPLSTILLESTLIPSLLYSWWMLGCSQRVYVLYIPQLLGGLGKIYDQVCSKENKGLSQITE